MGKITLTNIAEELAARSGMSKEATDNFVRAIIDTIEKGLQEDNLVKIKGLGTFKLMEMSDRGSVDINTGERITIKGYRKVTFTPDSAMKEFVNRPFAHFEPTELNEGYPSEEEELANVESEDLVSATSDIVELQESVVETVVAETETSSAPVAPLVVKSDEGETVVAEAMESVKPAEEIGLQSTATEELFSEEAVENEEIRVVEVQQVETSEQEMGTMENVNPVEPIENDEDEASGSAVDASGNTSFSTETEASEVFKQEEIPTVVSENKKTEIAHDTATEKNNTTRKDRHNRSGCGWFIIVLLIGLAYGIYYLMTVDQDILSGAYDDKFEEYNDMMVNPNLEEELGVEWGDDPKVETQLSSGMQERTEEQVPEKTEKTGNIERTETEEDLAQSEKAPVVEQPAPTPPSLQSKFCAVTPTESLEAKTVKDITPADTTDYAIEGTLLTHELKNGETIIQLAKKYYGDKRLWPYIVKYNWMKDYNNVAIGQMINIPVLKDKAQ